jgi:hypothetical protein
LAGERARERGGGAPKETLTDRRRPISSWVSFKGGW